MADKIVIFGGSGFLGQRLVRLAAEKGYQVVSVSRKGAPIPAESWHTKVEWVKADVFVRKEWQMVLEDAEVVVDCIGILQQKKVAGITYAKFNVEVAQILASEAKEQKVPLFVYISAKRFIPIILKQYFESKQQAEKQVRCYYPEALIIRPSLFIGKERQGTQLLDRFIKLIRKLPFFSNFLSDFKPQTVETGAKDILGEITQKLVSLENRQTG